MPKISPNYGHDEILKHYLGLPKWFLVPTTIQHGWYGDTHPADLESKNGEKVYLTWSLRMALKATGKTKKKVIVLSAPFVLFRRSEKIEISKHAKGTVVFPQHSTKSISVAYDIDWYCEELRKLPDNYHPITVCLHWLNLSEQAEQFRKHGFSVVSAGESRQGGTTFARNFYEILSKHKYSSSNDIGSYTFYAVEMGIPFFIFGETPQLLDSGEKKALTVTPEAARQKAKALKIFSQKTDVILPEQKEFIVRELGLCDALNREKLRKIYIKYGILHQIILAPVKPLTSIFHSCVRKINRRHKP